MTTKRHLTLEEYGRMVRVCAFDAIVRKVELVRGEMIEMNFVRYRCTAENTLSPMFQETAVLNPAPLFYTTQAFRF